MCLELCIGAYTLTAASVKSLCNMLKVNTTLRALDLRGNKISAPALRELAKAWNSRGVLSV